MKDLEFVSVLDTIGEHCISALGKNRVSELRPMQRVLEMKSELQQVNEYLSSFENQNRIPNHYFEEISREIHLLGIEDSFLEAKSFNNISSMSINVNGMLAFLKKFKEYYPTLFRESEDIELTKYLENTIADTISPHGEVLDKASDSLRQIRKELGRIRGLLGNSFNKSMAHYASLGFLDDIRESIIDNQRVLAVQAMYRKKIPGAILGNSKTTCND